MKTQPHGTYGLLLKAGFALEPRVTSCWRRDGHLYSTDEALELIGHDDRETTAASVVLGQVSEPTSGEEWRMLL